MKKIGKLFVLLVALAMVLSICLVFTACKEKKSLTGLKYEDGTLSWSADSVAGAAKESYEVFVNGVKKNLTSSEDGKTVSLDVSQETKGDKDFDVTVNAKGEDGTIEQTIGFKKLPAITVGVKDGKFDWSESASTLTAYGTLVYDIILDGKTMGNTDATSYRASSGAAHTLSVRPRVLGDTAFYFSNWSAEVTTSVLSTPEITEVKFNIQRDESGNATSANAELTWTSVNFIGGDASYKVWVNGIENDVTTNTFSTSAITAADFNVVDGINVIVQAIHTTDNVDDSAPSVARNFISLAPVTGLCVKNGVLMFNAVQNAAAYKVSINGTEFVTDTNSYVLGDNFESVNAAACAMPAEGYEAAENWSEGTISFNILTKPLLSFDTKLFTIEGDRTNVGEYEVVVDKVNAAGELVENIYDQKQSKDKVTFSHPFADEGKYYVYVRAISSSGNYLDSGYTEPYTVVRLGTIGGLSIEDIPATSNSQGYLLIKLDEVKEYPELVDRYKLFMDGTQISSTAKTDFRIAKPSTFDERTYMFSIQAVSDSNGTDKAVTLSSLNTVKFNMIKLAAPRNITLNAEGSVSWIQPAPVNRVLSEDYDNLFAGYEVVMLRSYTVDPESTTYDFPNTLNAEIIPVSVYAKSVMTQKSKATDNDCIVVRFEGETTLVELAEGNTRELDEGTALILGSDYSGSNEFRKLAQPTDFRMDNQMLSWSAVEDCKGYEVYYSTENNGFGLIATVDTPSFEFSKEALIDSPSVYDMLINEQGCAISVVALGNKGKDLVNGEMYSFDSEKSELKTVFKYDRPTEVQVSNDYLSWNEVPNATAYNVYSGETRIIDTVKTTSYDITGLDSSIYSIYIQAVGDDNQFFSSEKSDRFVFNKLNKMNITLEGGEYKWQAVDYAQIYNFVIDGKPYTVPADFEAEAAAKAEGKDYFYRFKPKFDHAGDIQVQFQTIGKNGAVDESFLVDVKKDGNMVACYTISSDVESFFQPVERLNTPELLDASKGAFELKAEAGRVIITANVKDEARATGYVFRIGGTEMASDSKTLIYNNAQHGQKDVEICYAANVFETDGKYVLGTTKYLLNSAWGNSKGSFNYLRDVYDIQVKSEGNPYSISWSNIIGARYQYYFELVEVIIDNGEFIYDENAEVLYASTQGETTTDFQVIVDLTQCIDGYVYNQNKAYGVRFYITVVGDNSSTVSDYTIVEMLANGLK